MKKTSILFLTIIVLSITVVFMVKAEAKKDEYKSFFVGECTLVIPSEYSLGITKDGNANFLSLPSSDFHMYNINWHKNAFEFLKEDFSKSQTFKTISSQKIDHLRIIKRISENKKEIFWIVGKNFFIFSGKLNDHVKALINSCNETWSERNFTFDHEEFIDQLKNDYDATDKEAKILVDTIMKSMEKDKTKK